MIMKNYRVQLQINCCGKCRHIFCMRHYDDGPEYFCNISKDRPFCGSVFMNEPAYSDEMDFDKWEKREEENGVDVLGICDNYEPLKIKE